MNSVGTAAVHGVTGNLAFTGLLAAANMLVGAQARDEFQVSALRDGVGEEVGETAFNRKQTATFVIIPIDAGGNLATAKSNVKTPDPLGVITIADHGIAEFDGTWNYKGADIGLTQEGYISYTMTATRKVKADGTKAAWTPVTVGS